MLGRKKLVRGEMGLVHLYDKTQRQLGNNGQPSRASLNSYELISLLLWQWSAFCSEVKRVLTVSREVIPTTVTSLVFDAHVACGLRSAVRKAPACTLFNNGGKETSRRRKRITSCDSLGSRRSLVFDSRNIRDVSSKKSAVCLVGRLQNTP